MAERWCNDWMNDVVYGRRANSLKACNSEGISSFKLFYLEPRAPILRYATNETQPGGQTLRRHISSDAGRLWQDNGLLV